MSRDNDRARWRYHNEPEFRERRRAQAKRGRLKWAPKRELHERLKKYGLSTEGYEAFLESQQFCCAVCKTDDPGRKKGWNVDHDHMTGTVRGLLCVRCNFMFGHAKDDPEILLAGAIYLQRN